MNSIAQARDMTRCIWIGGAGNVFCRREFVLPGAPLRATLRVVADPHSYANRYWQFLPREYPYENWLVGGSFLKYRIFANGKFVAAGPFRPLEDGVPVVHEFDLTASLVPGANALAVLCRGEKKGFALELEVECLGGEVVTVRSGPEWKQRDANSVFRPICWEHPEIEQSAKGVPSPGEQPEHLDGLAYPQGWKEPGFDDSSWPHAGVHGGVVERLEAPVIPSYVQTPCGPREIHRLGEGNYLVDFGRPVFGGIELACPVGGGSVELRLAEERHPDGHALYQMRTGNCFQEIWRFAPDSEPLFHMGVRMFRYAEVVGWRGAFDETSLSATSLGMPFETANSEFSCSDERLERVWQFCRDTLAHSTADVFTDCLTRERLCYEADSYITMLGVFNTDGSSGTARRSLEYLLGHPSWPCEWWQFCVPLFHEYLLHSGDYELIDRHYEYLRDKTTYHSLMRDGLIREFPRECIVDWPESARDGYDFGPGNALANAFAYWDLTTLAELARYTGRREEAREIEVTAGGLKAGFNAQLFDERSGLYVDSLGSGHSSFHANMFALRFGLVPEDRVPRCLAYLKKRGMSCSVYGAQFYLDTLFMHDEAELGVSLMTSDGPCSWIEMMNHGAVATTESWLHNAKPNMSWVHPWGASPANVITRHLFGLRPVRPGWSEFVFEPKPGGLKHGRLRITTPRGPVEAGFDWIDGAYRTQVRPGFDLTADEAAKFESTLPAVNREPVLI
jgi:alpha-L-rhamnosidase